MQTYVGSKCGVLFQPCIDGCVQLMSGRAIEASLWACPGEQQQYRHHGSLLVSMVVPCSGRIVQKEALHKEEEAIA
jgi:hypothetical protein